MKKLFTMFAMYTMVLTACTTTDEPVTEPQPETTTVKFDYSLFESGSLTRAAEDAYQDFYQKCILTKQNIPLNYELQFYYPNNTDSLIFDIKGNWVENNEFCIPTGTYRVKGKSHPKDPKGYKTVLSDSVFMSFDTDLTITLNQEVVTIPAQYDCYLLLFKADNIENIKYWYIGEEYNGNSFYLKPNNGYYCVFVNGWYHYQYNEKEVDILAVTTKTNDVIKIYTNNPRFQKGKYYYFNDATNTFFLDEMENGSE